MCSRQQYLNGDLKDKGIENVIPIPFGTSLQPLNLKFSDNQFLEVKQYTALQIASAFGIKPYQIGDYTKSSYASAEAQQLSLTNLINSVVNWFKSLPGKISSAISNGVTIIATWCSNMKNKAVSGVKNIANAIVNGFKSLPNTMLNIGKNIVEGIWNGIKNAKNWIIGKINDFAKGILDGMKSSLGIHSPSRVFRDEIGKYISQGIGVGITENQNVPIKALEDVGSNMLNSVKTINGLTLNRQIENTFKSSVSTDGAVLGLLNDILNKLDRNMQIVLDSGKLIGETVPAYDAAFGALRTQTSRGW